MSITQRLVINCPETGKRIYGTRNDALAFLAWVSDHSEGGCSRRAYQCGHCGFWHTTSKPRA